MTENHSAVTRLMYQLFIVLGKKSVSVFFLIRLNYSPTSLCEELKCYISGNGPENCT